MDKMLRDGTVWLSYVQSKYEDVLRDYGMFVVIYTANELSCKMVETKSFVVESILECVTVELAIENHKNVVVNCMYRTPGSNIDTFSENVEHIFSDAKGMKTIFVCGDLNIDLQKHESHKSTRHFLDMMYSLGLYPLIDKPIRITDSSATLIDKYYFHK